MEKASDKGQVDPLVSQISIARYCLGEISIHDNQTGEEKLYGGFNADSISVIRWELERVINDLRKMGG